MEHPTSAVDQREEKIIIAEPVSPTSSPVPAIKLQRKYSSGWTLSNNGNTTTSKLCRSGRVKLKLRSWMAEPLAVKEGDASLRLVTDLPRFNWLELKLNQKQDSLNEEPSNCGTPANNDNLPIVPLKIRILEKTSCARLSENKDLAMKKETPNTLVQAAQHQSKIDDTSEPAACTARWPLKKRFFRQECQISPVTSPVVSPVISPADSKPVSPKEICTKFNSDGLQRLSPPAQRGPVIMRNVILPPTPPASSAPPELMVVDQDKPLDLSKRLETPPASFRPPMKQKEETAEVEIIAMTSRLNEPVNQLGSFQPLRQRCTHNPSEIHGAVFRNDKEVVTKSSNIREYPLQRISLTRSTENSSTSDWSRHAKSSFRPYAEQRSSGGAIAGMAMVTPTTTRPFVLPPLRPLPHHRNSLVAQQQRVAVIRPEVQLHPVGMAQTSTGFVARPRLFHPQQVTATTKKPLSTASHSMTTLPSDWSLRSCVVCSRRADFRCAGCHGNAYCSTLCQARDWPNHSQLCQRNS